VERGEPRAGARQYRVLVGLILLFMTLLYVVVVTEAGEPGGYGAAVLEALLYLGAAVFNAVRHGDGFELAAGLLGYAGLMISIDAVHSGSVREAMAGFAVYGASMLMYAVWALGKAGTAGRVSEV
jgi:hypothetical protein